MANASTRNGNASNQDLSGVEPPPPRIAYRTKSGECFHGRAEDVLACSSANHLRGQVDLIFTSPPFPLNRKKKYDNLQGREYVRWLRDLAPLFCQFLKPTGSLVIEVGNSWLPGKP